jgi:hypothetical protein
MHAPSELICEPSPPPARPPTTNKQERRAESTLMDGCGWKQGKEGGGGGSPLFTAPSFRIIICRCMCLSAAKIPSYSFYSICIISKKYSAQGAED